jgi:ubiquinone/menaquinone biosynthesis C-methylase UbiE
MKYLQYGCGLYEPNGWRNFDASPTLWLQRLPIVGRAMHRLGGPKFPQSIEYGNIVNGLPVEENIWDGVYCSHVLEHLALEDCRKALSNTYKMLKNDGIFRLVLPDLEQQTTFYLSCKVPEASRHFMEYTFLGVKERPRGIGGLIKNWLGNSHHLWMWDYKALASELSQIGFRDIRRAQFGDSSDSMFIKAEDENRWTDSLGIECRR